ncbi:MAG: amidohydrolase family protein, partial [Vallitaleaceae bacterium]|nr:amidohydrolase family protein [Vallitaleaceae bacterium]
IKVLSSKGIVCSLGHTGADYETAVQAFEQGAKGMTHTFNAMTPLHHRKPGVVGAALTKDFYCEVIADNIHLHKDLYDIILKMKKPEHILLVTDCVRATGMPEGDYELGGQKVHLEKGKCSLEDGTLAGSTLKLNVALKNFVESTHMKLEDAILTITENPATYIGEFHRRGSLCEGKLADITIMDDRFEVYETLVQGRLLFQRNE